jgi:hypothetical protein
MFTATVQIFALIAHLATTLVRVALPGGVRAVIAESLPSETSASGPQPIAGSGASADNSLRSTDDAPKVTLVKDGKRLEIRHLGFAACGPSICQGVFGGPKSLDAPEPSTCGAAIATCFCVILSLRRGSNKYSGEDHRRVEANNWREKLEWGSESINAR